LIITRSKSHWEQPEFWTRGNNTQQIVRSQGLTYDIVGTRYSYVSIGKVASTFMGEFLANLKWTNTSYNYNEIDKQRLPKTYIVILRDPIERWCSGIVEYLVTHTKFLERGHERGWNLLNRETLDLIFGVAKFDRHTCPQVDYLHGLDTNECVFFKLDSNFEDTMKRFAEKELNSPINDAIIRDFAYNTSERETHRTLRNTIDYQLKNEPRYMKTIKDHFVDDIILFNQVTFYGNNL